MLQHLRARTPFIIGLGVIFLGIYVAELFNLYSLWPHFDKVLHVSGGFVVAWFALALLQDDVKRLAGWKQLVILTGIACLVGVVWEFAEYGANFLNHSHPTFYHYFHGGDLADTLGDIAADIVGGILLSLWAVRKEQS